MIHYIISFDDKEIVINKEKNKKIKISIFDVLNSLSFIIIIIGIFAQLPLIHEPEDYLVKVGLTLTYIIICKTLIFNKKDINSSFVITITIIGFILFSILLDFFNTFQNYFDYNITFSPIKVLKEINKKYPFLYLMFYSVLNGALTQIIFILLFIF